MPGSLWVRCGFWIKKVYCRSLRSIHILNNHTPTARLTPHPETWCGLIIFHCTEVEYYY